MKIKPIQLLGITVLLVTCMVGTVLSIPLENFDSWATGAPADNSSSLYGYAPFGAELTGSEVVAKSANPSDHFLRVSYSSPTDGGSPIIGGTGPFASLGIAQTIDFAPALSLSSPDAQIAFDMRTNLPSGFASVFSVEIKAEALFLDGTPTGDGQVGFRLGFSNMLDLPATSWTHFEVLVSDLTTFSNDQSVVNKKPNLNKITGIQLLVLQTDADLTGTGTIDIDNLAIIPEPTTMILLGSALIGLFRIKRKR